MKTAKQGVASAVFALALSFSAQTPAHDQPLDDNGCHRDGLYGLYHCHEGEYAGQSFNSIRDYPGYTRPERRVTQTVQVKMGVTGVCFAPDSPLYQRQKKYWLFPSMNACIQAGGREDPAVVFN